MVELLSEFSRGTGIYAFMNSPWGWPTAESIHFLGLCMLIGTVGVFDLRMLGLGQGISYGDLHKFGHKYFNYIKTKALNISTVAQIWHLITTDNVTC